MKTSDIISVHKKDQKCFVSWVKNHGLEPNKGGSEKMRRQKPSKWMGVLVIFGFFMSMTLVASESWAQTDKYPNKPIEIVMGYAPGSGDLVFRPFIEKLPEYLGQPVVLVYKPGASGARAGSFVTKAKPDGYTLMGSAQAPFITTPLTMPELDYTLDDFAPICRLSSGPMVVAVKADSPWKTLKDVVEEAKKSPGKLTYSTAGVFTSMHIAMEMFGKSASISMTHVPAKGGNPATMALLGGHVSMVSNTTQSVVPHIKSGALRLIGVLEKERLKEFPDVPTFVEAGYPVVLSGWHGLMAPKGTPDEVIRTIHLAFKKVIDNHEDFIKDRLQKLSLKLHFSGPDEFAKEARAEYEARKIILKDLIKPTK